MKYVKPLTLAGHPVHPMVIAAPLGLLPFSAVMDCMYLGTGKKVYSDAARMALKGGIATATVAAVTGVLDYLNISPGGKMKRTANTHGLLNVGVMAMQTASLMTRHQGRSGWLPTLFNVIGNVGLVASAWYGGDLVYEQGMRVKPASDKPEQDAKLPGDDRLAGAFEALSSVVTDRGPGSEE